MNKRYEFDAIGRVHSPFKEKFGIPRQPGLVPEINAVLELLPPFDRSETVSGLQGYSHIWVQFVFHQTVQDQWQPTVRPPRLGGNRRVGVFASRSPFRPNPIGLSVVKLDAVRCAAGRVELAVSGVDMVDGTPVLDIKPYIPYVDSIPDALSGFASVPPEHPLDVYVLPAAEEQLRLRPDAARLRVLIKSILEADPRPAYVGESQPDRVYGIRLYDFDLRWRVEGNRVEVLELAPA